MQTQASSLKFGYEGIFGILAWHLIATFHLKGNYETENTHVLSKFC